MCSEQMGVPCDSHSVSHKTQQEAREHKVMALGEDLLKVASERKDEKVCVRHTTTPPPPSPSTIQEKRISVLIAPEI